MLGCFESLSRLPFLILQLLPRLFISDISDAIFMVRELLNLYLDLEFSSELEIMDHLNQSFCSGSHTELFFLTQNFKKRFIIC